MALFFRSVVSDISVAFFRSVMCASDISVTQFVVVLRFAHRSKKLKKKKKERIERWIREFADIGSDLVLK